MPTAAAAAAVAHMTGTDECYPQDASGVSIFVGAVFFSVISIAAAENRDDDEARAQDLLDRKSIRRAAAAAVLYSRILAAAVTRARAKK